MILIREFELIDINGKARIVVPLEPIDFDWVLTECENSDTEISDIVIPLKALVHSYGNKKEAHKGSLRDRRQADV